MLTLDRALIMCRWRRSSPSVCRSSQAEKSFFLRAMEGKKSNLDMDDDLGEEEGTLGGGGGGGWDLDDDDLDGVPSGRFF